MRRDKKSGSLMPTRREALCMLPVLAGGAAFVPPDARAQAGSAAYPQRPIKLVVPNAPGSSVDTISRLVGNYLAPVIGQALVVENKAGAAGAVGIEAGKAAIADGYTLIAASSSSITVAPLLQKAVSYTPLTDFDFVCLVAVLPNVLAARSTLYFWSEYAPAPVAPTVQPVPVVAVAGAAPPCCSEPWPDVPATASLR